MVRDRLSMKAILLCTIPMLLGLPGCDDEVSDEIDPPPRRMPARMSVKRKPLAKAPVGRQPGRPTSTPKSTPPRPLGDSELVAHADRRTVLVFAEKHGSVSVGTGFFIGEQQVLTNAHVVEGGTDVGILSHVFEGLTRAEVAHIGTGGADFALLVLSDVRAPDHFVLTRQCPFGERV